MHNLTLRNLRCRRKKKRKLGFLVWQMSWNLWCAESMCRLLSQDTTPWLAIHKGIHLNSWSSWIIDYDLKLANSRKLLAIPSIVGLPRQGLLSGFSYGFMLISQPIWKSWRWISKLNEYPHCFTNLCRFVYHCDEFSTKYNVLLQLGWAFPILPILIIN